MFIGEEGTSVLLPPLLDIGHICTPAYIIHTPLNTLLIFMVFMIVSVIKLCSCEILN